MAPHLSSVPPPTVPDRPKKTFPELVTAIYEDSRVGHETRELLLAVAYAVDLAKREEGVSALRIARRKLGVEHGRYARYDRLIADDAPRYEPAWRHSSIRFDRPACEAPRLRPYRPRPYKPRTQPDPDVVEPTPLRPLPPTIVHVEPGYTPPRDWRTEDGVCGARSDHRVEEKDPRTGWTTAHWFCKRHHDHAERVAAQVAAQNAAAPEPVPNTGGLLPCYFAADWAKVYAHYARGWTPPSYGLAADDWPTLDNPRPMATARRGLRAITDLATPPITEGPK